MPNVSTLGKFDFRQAVSHLVRRIENIFTDTPGDTFASSPYSARLEARASKSERQCYNRLTPGTVNEEWFSDHEDPVESVRDLELRADSQLDKESDWLR